MPDIGSVSFIDLSGDFKKKPLIPFTLDEATLDNPSTLCFTFSHVIQPSPYFTGFSVELYVTGGIWSSYEDGFYYQEIANNQLILSMPDSFGPDDAFRISYSPEFGNIARNSDGVLLGAISNMNVINGL